MEKTSSSQGTTANFSAEVFETAKALAKKHRLWRHDGSLVCWLCKERDGELPSLHCTQCREAHRRAKQTNSHSIEVLISGHVYKFPRRGNDEYRWRGMIENMRNEQQITAEMGRGMLKKSANLPGADRWQAQLQLAYDERFGDNQAPPRSHWAGGYEWAEGDDPTCWEILELDPHSNRETIVKRYRQLALRHHPDRHPDAAKKMADINRAYHEAINACTGR